MKTQELRQEIGKLKGQLCQTANRSIIQTVDKNGELIGSFRLNGCKAEPCDPEPLFTMLHSFFEMFQSDRRFIVAYSGRASGKSWAFAQWLLAESYEQQHRNLFLREKQNSLQESSYYLLKSIILSDPRLTDHFDVLSNRITARNGSEFTFRGLQSFTASSIKSFEGFDRAYVDEAQALSRRSLDLLLPTIRKPGSKIMFGLNPENIDDPVYEDFIEIDRPDTEKQKLNYLDNPFNSQETLNLAKYDMEHRSDIYSHIWEGEILVRSELRILTNWHIWDFSYKDVKDKEKKLIDRFKTNSYDACKNIKIFSGLDFGSKDPCALVLFYNMKNTNRIYISYEYYRTEKTARTLADDLLEIPEIDSYCPVVGDSSRPEMIEELRQRGINIRGCKKPRILDDIGRLQNFEIYVHPSCTNMISELSLYSWKQNKHTDEILNVPEDKNNHLIDALRYGTQNISIFERRNRYEKLNVLWG